MLSDGEQFYQAATVVGRGAAEAEAVRRTTRGRNFPEHVFSVWYKEASAFDVTVDLKGSAGKYGANLDTLDGARARASAILAHGGDAEPPVS